MTRGRPAACKAGICQHGKPLPVDQNDPTFIDVLTEPDARVTHLKLTILDYLPSRRERPEQDRHPREQIRNRCFDVRAWQEPLAFCSRP
jgi:hypothetical protein